VNYRSENGPFMIEKTIKKVPRLGEKKRINRAFYIELQGETHWIIQPFIQAYSIVENGQDLKLTVHDLLPIKKKTA
jgi:uncharacterized protein